MTRDPQIPPPNPSGGETENAAKTTKATAQAEAIPKRAFDA